MGFQDREEIIKRLKFLSKAPYNVPSPAIPSEESMYASIFADALLCILSELEKLTSVHAQETEGPKQ